MGGVYGAMLGFFPELMRTYEVFKMPSRIGAGYGERYGKRRVLGYFSKRRSREAAIMGDVKTQNNRGTFWERNESPANKSGIEQFDFFEDEGEMYQFIDDDEFGHEGGFTKWIVQYVPAVTDRQHTNTKVDEVIKADY
jgi:hypothetical protein